MVRNSNWKNGLSLYSHDLQISADSYDLENNLGVELYRAGRRDEAKPHFMRSTELAEDWWINWNNLGVVVEEEGDLETATRYYQKSIDHGQYFLAYQNLARIKTKQDPEAAVVFIKESLRLLPYNADLYKWWGIAEYQLGNKELALQAVEISFNLLPVSETAQLYQLMEEDGELKL
jgi:Flp pilus assembly protein TadD